MARLENIRFVPHRCTSIDRKVQWTREPHGIVIDGLPQIFWMDSTPWVEANLWATERASSRHVSIKTVQANMVALHAYANWLESQETLWFEFPRKKQDRCLVRYRGALINARDKGELAPSTAKERMSSLIRFYRWVQVRGLLSPEYPMWQDRAVFIRIFDKVGFERSLMRVSTDLSIPNRRRPGERLEDGLLPVSSIDQASILTFTQEHSSEELLLILSLGFLTGMRLGTIADLKIQTVERAVPDPASPNLFRLAVGPGADPPVHTKFSVTGQVWITRNQLDELRRYAYSIRRLKREAKAAPENRDLVFLTRFGNPYARGGTSASTAINVEMHALRKLGVAHGLVALHNFHFHQSRCTFGTEIARIAIGIGGAINAIAIVKEALLHKDEATSFRYIKFIEKNPIKAEMANVFTVDFLGLLKNRAPENE